MLSQKKVTAECWKAKLSGAEWTDMESWNKKAGSKLWEKGNIVEK